MSGKSNRDRVIEILNDSENKSLSKPRIRQELNLAKETFSRIAREIEADGIAETRTGQGGTLHLLEKGKKIAKNISNEYIRATKVESDLYPIFLKHLKETNSDESSIIDIDNSSSKAKGKWRNPDFCRVISKQHKLISSPNSSVHVVTYELKPLFSNACNWDIVGIYETAAHSSIANESYLVIEMPHTTKDEYSISLINNLSRIKGECLRHKIGLIKMIPEDKRGKSWRYEYELHAQNVVQPMYVIDEFLTTVIGKNHEIKRKLLDIFNPKAIQLESANDE